MDTIKNLLVQIKDLLYDLINYIKEDTNEKEIKLQKQNESKEKLYLDMEQLILINNETRVVLTLNEAILLRELLKEKERLCTYESLCKVLYGYELDDYALNSIRILVFRLKKKINGILRIKNIRNRGFIAYEVKVDG